MAIVFSMPSKTNNPFHSEETRIHRKARRRLKCGEKREKGDDTGTFVQSVLVIDFYSN